MGGVKTLSYKRLCQMESFMIAYIGVSYLSYFAFWNYSRCHCVPSHWKIITLAFLWPIAWCCMLMLAEDEQT